jgi:hypothetical protein
MINSDCHGAESENHIPDIINSSVKEMPNGTDVDSAGVEMHLDVDREKPTGTRRVLSGQNLVVKQAANAIVDLGTEFL